MLKLVKRHKGEVWYVRGAAYGFVYDQSTRTTDRKSAEKIKTKLEGDALRAHLTGASADATFGRAVYAYLEEGGEKRFLQKLIAHIGDRPLSSITTAYITEQARVVYPTASDSTLNRQYFAPLSAILRCAARNGMCNPIQVRRRKEPNARNRWLSPGEAKRLLAACPGHLRNIVTFMFLTGARTSETLELTWENVDLERKQVVFRDTKNGTTRGVPLHSDLVTILSGLEHRSGHVFRTHRGKPYLKKEEGGGGIKTAFAKACAMAEIIDFHPHDCRHTWATWHYQQHRNIKLLQELGGWKSERMVLRYSHNNVQHLSESIENLPSLNAA